MVKYLVGRGLDPLLGVATGVFAYYLYETDPRNQAQRPPGRTLLELGKRFVYNERPPYTLYSGPNPFGDQIERASGANAKVV